MGRAEPRSLRRRSRPCGPFTPRRCRFPSKSRCRSQPLDSSKTADVLDLMRRLRSDIESERTAPRRELHWRGFSEVDLELARQLFSPDIEVRKQLAAAVPRLASVDASRWLLWLAADPQPEVRRAAISTLATTGDPALLDRVEAMAQARCRSAVPVPGRTDPQTAQPGHVSWRGPPATVGDRRRRSNWTEMDSIGHFFAISFWPACNVAPLGFAPPQRFVHSVAQPVSML